MPVSASKPTVSERRRSESAVSRRRRAEGSPADGVLAPGDGIPELDAL